MTQDIEILSKKIKDEALNIGFSDCGICQVDEFIFEYEMLTDYNSNGYNAEMAYLKNNIDIRKKPSLLLENAKSIVSVAINYKLDICSISKRLKISRYALVNDYHKVIKSKLEYLVNFIKQFFPDLNYRIFVDSAPIFEKSVAQKAGIGWMGKNSLLITKKFGSYVFLGEIIIDKELKSDKQIENQCGNCRLCIEYCPTNALIDEYKLDARKCISYLTIEKKSELSEHEKLQLKNNIIGCDICQDICPYNKKETFSSEFKINQKLASLSLEELSNLSKEQYKELFKNSSISRVKYEKFIELVKSSLM